jgi:hypothetical protein
LHDLGTLYGGNGGEAAGRDAGNGGTTVDPKRAQSIALRLKVLPKAAAERFGKHFGITRLKDLSGREVEEAIAYLDMLAAEFEASAQHEGEVEPLA